MPSSPVFYNLLLFAITFAGGSTALWFKKLNNNAMHYLLAFSGSFLLSITFLHLLPESFAETNGKAGLYLLAGFFIQLIIQRLTHGLEHGHVHVAQHQRVPLLPILAGLTIHAFMEGLPLGFIYADAASGTSLYIAVAAHKLPEAVLATSLVFHNRTRLQAVVFLLLFSAITPLASIVAGTGAQYYQATHLFAIVLPIVAGAFIHIATTIFFESGTKQHMLTFQKILAILLGLGAGLLTIISEL